MEKTENSLAGELSKSKERLSEGGNSNRAERPKCRCLKSM